jgi:hypothetical protein
VKNDLESMQVRQHRTWQERQTFGAWGQHARRRIFTEYVSRQPLFHSKCDQCHGDLNFYAVRCMTCKRHLCHQCDANTHSSMPFHRRLLCSCQTLATLQPHHFIDEEGNIITKGICLKIKIQTHVFLNYYALLQMFVYHALCLLNAVM